MNVELTGQLKVVNQKEVISDKFTKREIVIATDTDTQYPQPICIQLNQKIIDSVDNLQIGTFLKVSCNLRGREWFNPTKNITQYFNTIEAWKIEAVGVQQQPTNEVQYNAGKIEEVQPPF